MGNAKPNHNHGAEAQWIGGYSFDRLADLELGYGARWTGYFDSRYDALDEEDEVTPL